VRRVALALVVVAATAPPAAALSLATTWLCFFDSGSAELSPRSQAIVLEFTDWWHRMRRGGQPGWPHGAPMPAYTMRIEVQGHADAAEAAAGKGAVGAARAEAVAASLRLNGVPADLVKAAAFGAERLMVPVAGAELQNRRVELRAR
jgi:outer membrane protein OmpA-like peptidoglycan-associated protein